MSNIFTGGTISADSENSPTQAKEFAFDGLVSTLWYRPVGAGLRWIAYDLGASNDTTLKYLRIKPGTNGNGNGLNAFTVWGSNLTTPDGDDEGDWDDLGSFAHGDNSDYETFDVSNATSYRHYRISIESNHRVSFPTDVIIEEIEGFVEVPFPIDGDTKLLLHCDGTDTSTSFPDDSPSAHSPVANGDAQVDTAQSKFGGASSLHDGVDDYISVPDSADWDWGTSDMAIDCWVRFASVGGNHCIVGRPTSGVSYFYWALEGGNNVRFRDYNSGNIIDLHFGNPSFAINTWYHLAITRDGSNFRFFINGIQFGSTLVSAASFLNRSTELQIGNNTSINYDFSGHIDEVRVSVGNSRWTSNFIPPDVPYNDDILPLEATLTLETPTLVIDCTVTPSPLALTSTLVAPSNVGVVTIVNPSPLTLTGNIIAPTIGLGAVVTPDPLELTGSILTPAIKGVDRVDFASSIMHHNPLVIVSGSSPTKITTIDISTPSLPVYDTQLLVGVTDAKSVAYNSTTDEYYVACADGMVVKVDATNLATQTIIDLSDTDDLLTISALNTFGLIFTGTENVIGELYTLENYETFLIDTDFNVLANKQYLIDSDFNSIEAFLIDSNFEAISELNFIMDTDFKCLTAPVDNLTPIAQTDCTILIDAVELEPNDILIETINIVKTVDERDTATFTLCRQHDNPNRDFENNLRTITNQNNVEIRISGQTVFTGQVSRFSPSYSTRADQITVEALGAESGCKYNRVTLSLGSVDKRLSLYDILLQNYNIYNPVVDANSEDPVKFNGVRVPYGDHIEEHVARRLYFDVFGKDAQRIQEGSFQARKNHTYFWSPTVRKFGNHFYFIDSNKVTNNGPVFNEPEQQNLEASIPKIDPETEDKDKDKKVPNITFDALPITFDQLPIEFPFDDAEFGKVTQQYFKYIGTSLTPVSSDLWFLLQAKHRRQKVFPNTIEKIGSGQVFISDFSDTVSDPTATYNELKAKGWITSTGFVTQKFKDTTEPSELSLTTASCNNSGIYDILSDALAYTVGSAPFLTVNTRNGILLTKPKWVDEPNGLYSIKDEGYDYTSFVRRVAELEFQKLSNINGDILPETTANIELSIDSMFYYNLNVLTRINVDNTVDTNIYKNSNGFPVAIKSLVINCSTMRVSLNCDNKKSNKELEQIDGEFPCEDDQQYLIPSTRTLVALKSDMKTALEVDGPNDAENEIGAIGPNIGEVNP